MKVQGTITWVGETQQGTSRQGNPWQKRPFVLQYLGGQYPKSILFESLDEKSFPLLYVGAQVAVDFDITAREYNGRYYNDLRVWRDGIHVVAAQAPTPAASNDDLPY